ALRAASALEDAARRPRIERLLGLLQALLQVTRRSGDDQRRRRVERDHVAARALLALEDREDDPRVGRGVAAREVLGPRAREPELLGVDRALEDAPVLEELARAARSGRRQLVGPVLRVDDERALAARGLERARDEVARPVREDADELPPRARRVHERAEEVEDRADAELLARGGDVLERRVVARREQEGEAVR